jgi:Ca2+-binding RTX toxin-like protein
MYLCRKRRVALMLNHVLLLSIMITTFGLLIGLPASLVHEAMAIDDIFGSQNIQSNLQIVQSSSANIKSSAASNSLIICPLTPPFICDGTNEDDIIIGTPVKDTINGFEGNDKIQGNNFPDIVFGGPGNDVISGGEGTDTLFGEDGNDVVQGDSGTNVVFGGGGASIYGGKGDDTLLGGSDNDILTGGPGHDYFDCNEGWDTVTDFDSNDDTVNNNCEKLIKK